MSKLKDPSNNSDNTSRTFYVPLTYSLATGTQNNTLNPTDSGPGTPPVPWTFAWQPPQSTVLPAQPTSSAQRPSNSGSGAPPFPWWFSVDQPTNEKESISLPADGRYRLANASLELELRIDINGSNIISADLFAGGRGVREYLASLRSRPGMNIDTDSNPLQVIIEDRGARRAEGILRVLSADPDTTAITLTTDTAIEALPIGQPITFSGHFEGTEMRVLGLEIESEHNVEKVVEWQRDGQIITVESCLRQAGFDVHNAGDRNHIPPPNDHEGWDEAQLHGLMSDFAQARLDRPNWQLQALMLHKPRMTGLNGIMFDSGNLDLNDLPRQGFALFQHEIRNPIVNVNGGRAERPDWQRKAIQTFVHELGHALNLAHRFEREVGRADSTSFMNYDWKYLGGGNQERFWRNFSFSFDNDELAFLRHGPYPAVVPGGAGFRSVPYWENSEGGYVPYRGEVPTNELSLRLRAPQAGTLFAFGQPVLLTINLVNNTQQPLKLPGFVLDPKAGFLEIMVQRIAPGRSDGGESFRFNPVVHRCMDLSPALADTIGSGKYIENNLNLTFGSAGFTFMEPGNYRVTAVLSLPINRDYAWHIESEPLSIRIGYPRDDEDERTAMNMFRNDVGYYLALGGSDALSAAAEVLEEIVKRRQHRQKTSADPLVVNILRCQALNSLRPFMRYAHGEYRPRAVNKDKGKALLEQIETSVPIFLDPCSAAQTDRLIKQLRTESK